MMEITIKNFEKEFVRIEDILRKCRFIAIDSEFSALNISDKLQISLFDAISERYEKLRKTCEEIIPVQIGVTAFTFDRDTYEYTADIFSFYIFPKTFSFIDRRFLCQSSSLQFLCDNSFDFNKFIYEGIPYVNRIEEEEISHNLRNGTLVIGSSQATEIESLQDRQGQIISKWIFTAKEGDTLVLKEVEKYKHNPDILYTLHKSLRLRFNDILWTYEENDQFVVKKVTKSEFTDLIKQFDLDERVLLNIVGFTRLFRLITTLQKPIVGHNLLTDLMLLVQHFDNPLPKSYARFKDKTNELFPAVYDTKCLSFNIVKKLIPETKRWEQNTLPHLYNYFKGGAGRHLAANSPLIEPRTPLENYDQFHHAGWDSYCTGYIFIRMAHIYATNKFKHNRKFMSNELFAAVGEFKNRINLIRASASYIQLDGEDPPSSRPPRLIVEAVNNKPLNISQITSLLSTYGFVEVKSFSSGNKLAIVAVDNFGSARRILKNFKTHKDIRVYQYNALKHSSVARVAFWSGVVVTGALLAWITTSKLRK